MIKIILILLMMSMAGTLIFIGKSKKMASFINTFTVNATAKGTIIHSPMVSSVGTSCIVIISALMIAWGAEVGQFIVSQGMALAILAWLQVMPEFMVEAAITHDAAIDPASLHLITANFTGSNRLLVGLGWPLIFFVSYYFHKKRLKRMKTLKKKPKEEYYISLKEEHSVEVLALLIPTAYFFIIYIKATLTLFDSALFIFMYLVYIWVLGKLPPESEDEMAHVHGIPKAVLKRTRRVQIIFVVLMFLIGGTILFFVAEPFLHSLEAVAILTFGAAAQFFFIQWIAPFLSEFPEKLSAFYWAKTIKFSPMALMNMVSSKINQWTVLIAMIPMVYCVSLWRVESIHFDDFQRSEILLTIAQSLYAVTCIMKMRLTSFDASTLFILWFIQLLFPPTREPITFVYFILSACQLIYYRKEIIALRDFSNTMKKYILKPKNV